MDGWREVMVITVDLEVLCKCGRELSVKNRYASQIEIDPCDDCGLEKYNEGYDARVKEESDG